MAKYALGLDYGTNSCRSLVMKYLIALREAARDCGGRGG